MSKYLFITSLLMISICNAQNGTLDTTFGTNGYADYDFTPAYLSPEHLAEQSDGKFLVSGSNTLEPGRIVVIRFLESGAIDNSYGVNGRAIYGTTSTYTMQVFKMILQPDNKLILYAKVSNSIFLFLRFNQDGSLDTGFGQNGVYSAGNFNIQVATDFIIQNDGKILITYGRGFGNAFIPFFLRLNNNGTLDTSFGLNGKVQNNSIVSKTYELIGQQDGKFIAIFNDAINYVIKRFNNDGSLDTSYLGNNYNLNTPYDTFAIVLQPDGKCLIKTTNDNYDVILLKFNNNGTLDANFGNNGIKYYNLPNIDFGSGYYLVLQTDGKILVSGTYFDVANSFVQMAMLRFNANGSIDNIFGNNGLVFIRNNDQYTNSLDSLLFLQNGKILHGCTYKYGALNPTNSTGIFTGFERFNSGVQLSNEKFEVKKTIKVSPNPSSGFFNLNLSNDFNNYKEIQVYDLLGKLILNQYIENQNQVTIDLSIFEAGYYLAKFQNDNYSTVVKLLKN